MRQSLENSLKHVPDDFLAMVAQIVLGHANDTTSDYSSPILKPVVARIYPIFIIQYGLLAIAGMVTNTLTIAYITKYKLHRDATHAFIVNLAVCHVVICVFVLPVTLMVLLIQNWIFGQFLCFFLPLLQVGVV
jgi:prolipoprotein diacylglyceryltransferase